MDKLIEIYNNWLRTNDLPSQSADELLIEYSAYLSFQQKEWLIAFIRFWDQQQAFADGIHGNHINGKFARGQKINNDGESKQ